MTGAELGIGVEPVGSADRPLHPALVGGERVRRADAADHDQLGGERSDPRQPLQLGDRVGAAEVPEPVARQEPGPGGLTERSQLVDLAGGEPGLRRGELGQGIGSGERAALAELIAQAALDRGGLPHADPLAEDRPRRGLVGRVEQDRAQPAEAALQLADERVPSADVLEFGAVDIDREDALDVPAGLAGQVLGRRALELAANALAALAESDDHRPPVAVDCPGEPQLAGLTVGVGTGEPLGEGCGRRQ